MMPKATLGYNMIYRNVFKPWLHETHTEKDQSLFSPKAQTVSLLMPLESAEHLAEFQKVKAARLFSFCLPFAFP